MHGSLAEKALWHRTINHSRTPNLKRITAHVIHQSTYIFSDFYERTQQGIKLANWYLLYVQLQTGIRYVRTLYGVGKRARVFMQTVTILFASTQVIFNSIFIRDYGDIFNLFQVESRHMRRAINSVCSSVNSSVIHTDTLCKIQAFPWLRSACERDSTEMWYSNQ